MIPLTEDAKAPPADFHPTVAMAANIDATSSTAKYARYIHQTLCSPTAATLLLALTKSTELKITPGLTATLIHNHFPKSTATDKGHMRRHCANTASTRNNHPAIVLARAEVDNMFPMHEACAVHDMFCFAALADATLDGFEALGSLIVAQECLPEFHVRLARLQLAKPRGNIAAKADDGDIRPGVEDLRSAALGFGLAALIGKLRGADSGAANAVTILAEPPVALVDKNVDRHKTRVIAEGYLNFLYSPLAQDIIGKNHYRPRNAAAAAKFGWCRNAPAYSPFRAVARTSVRDAPTLRRDDARPSSTRR